MNRNAPAVAVMVGISEARSGSGISSTISISKTMKMILRRKNRIENGIRALFFGSNPHSKGDDFSRSDRLRVDSNHAAPKVSSVRMDAATVENRNKDMDWEL